MEPAEVIRTIYDEHYRLWKTRTTNQEFCRALGRGLYKAPKVSRFMDGKPYPELERALADPDKQKKVEDLLELPSLFTATTNDEIHAIVQGGRKARLDCIAVGSRCEHDWPAACELAAAERLLEKISDDEEGPVAWWPTNFQSGGTFIAQLMASLPKTKLRYSKAFVARPSFRLAPFDAELRALAKALDVEANGHSLATALVEKKVLLILVQHQPASTKAAESSSQKTLLRSLFDELEEAAERGAIGVPVLALGEIEWLEKPDEADLTFEKEMEGLLSIQPGDRWDFFKEQWRRFRSLKQVDRTDEAGSVLKRARWHYEGVRERLIPPMHVRLRAIIGSNMENLSAFDPTAGLKRMVGPTDELPADIRSFIEDIEGFLEAMEDVPFADSATRVLRLVATSRYWLTLEALEDFYRELEPKKKFDMDVVDDRLDDVSPAIIKDDVQKGIRFVAGVGLKAIVQDHWMARDPEDRALSHYLVAARLHNEEKENAAFQSLEFPYEHHWGDSQLFINGEIIRHLMRSVESWPGAPAPTAPLSPIYPPQTQIDFPQPPELGTNDNYPSEVLTYCYFEIFGNRMNRRIHNPDARALSDRHGLYMLAAELMQLMSAGNMIGTPHPALPEYLRRSFIRECGFALLNIGELEKAQSCFEQLLKEGKSTDYLDHLTDRLDLALVLTVRGLKTEADNELTSAGEIFRQIPGSEEVALNGPSSEKLVRLKRRLHGRRAYLSYFKKDYSGCRTLLDDLGGPDVINDTDLLHVYMATLIRINVTEKEVLEASEVVGEPISVYATAHRDVESKKTPTPSLQDEALKVCYRALFRLTSEGKLHEAIGFRIALAHYTLSIDGRIAASEAILDQVHLDILKYGCSEQTFLAFMLRAGRLLMRDNRELRAYASYLRPCLERSLARGYLRQAAKAAEVALLVLDQIEERRRTHFEAWPEFVASQIAEEILYQEKDVPRSSEGYPLDPLYGYSFADSRDLIHRLAVDEAVVAERQYVEAMLARTVGFD